MMGSGASITVPGGFFVKIFVVGNGKDFSTGRPNQLH
jgi:hypothetical protein